MDFNKLIECMDALTNLMEACGHMSNTIVRYTKDISETRQFHEELTPELAEKAANLLSALSVLTEVNIISNESIESYLLGEED